MQLRVACWLKGIQWKLHVVPLLIGIIIIIIAYSQDENYDLINLAVERTSDCERVRFEAGY